MPRSTAPPSSTSIGTRDVPLALDSDSDASSDGGIEVVEPSTRVDVVEIVDSDESDAEELQFVGETMCVGVAAS